MKKVVSLFTDKQFETEEAWKFVTICVNRKGKV